MFENKKYYFSNNKDQQGFEFARSDEKIWKLYEIWKERSDQLSDKYKKYLNQGRMEFDLIGTFDKFYSLENNRSFTVDELFPNGFNLKDL